MNSIVVSSLIIISILVKDCRLSESNYYESDMLSQVAFEVKCTFLIAPKRFPINLMNIDDENIQLNDNIEQISSLNCMDTTLLSEYLMDDNRHLVGLDLTDANSLTDLQLDILFGLELFQRISYLNLTNANRNNYLKNLNFLDKLVSLNTLILDYNEHINYTGLFVLNGDLFVLSLKGCFDNASQLPRLHHIKSIHYMGLGSNNLNAIRADNLPEFIHVLDLSDNRYDRIEAFLFEQVKFIINMNRNQIERIQIDDNHMVHTQPTSLTVNLKANRIRNVDVNMKTEIYKTNITFKLAHNPLVCDCNSTWLVKTNDITMKIPDYNQIECSFMASPNGPSVKPITESTLNDFNCQYTDTCSNDCECCSYYSCYCRSICPKMCKCYVNADITHNTVDCTISRTLSFNQTPSALASILREANVELINELHISNTNESIQPRSFFAYKQLKHLHLNNLNMSEIKYNTFLNLKTTLETLDLSDNHLTELNLSFFSGFKNLKKLILANNNISVLINFHFLSIRQIEALSFINLLNNPLSTDSLKILKDLHAPNRTITIQVDVPLDSSDSMTTTTTTTTTPEAERIRPTNPIGFRTTQTATQTRILVHETIAEPNENANETKTQTKTTFDFQKLFRSNSMLIYSTCGVLMIVLVVFFLIISIKYRSSKLTMYEPNRASLGTTKQTTHKLPVSLMSSWCLNCLNPSNYDDEAKTLSNNFEQLVSSSLDDVKLQIKIYYHYTNQAFVNDYLVKILSNIRTSEYLPKIEIIFKVQEDFFIDDEHDLYVSTCKTTAKNINYKHKNTIAVALFLISNNFFGLKYTGNTQGKQSKRKFNKNFNQFKIFLFDGSNNSTLKCENTSSNSDTTNNSINSSTKLFKIRNFSLRNYLYANKHEFYFSRNNSLNDMDIVVKLECELHEYLVQIFKKFKLANDNTDFHYRRNCDYSV